MIQAFSLYRGISCFTELERYMAVTYGGNNVNVYHIGASVTPWSVAGDFRNVVLWSASDAAPTPAVWNAGTQYALTLYKNGAATSLVVTIASGEHTARNDSDVVSVAPGDLITWRITQTGGAPASAKLFMVCEFHSESDVTSGYACCAGWTSAGGYYSPITGYADTTYAYAANYIATAGAITRIDVALNAQPGAQTHTVAVYKNGVIQDGSGGTVDTRVSLTGTATTGHSTFVCPVAVGDRVALGSSGTNSNYLSAAMAFDADEAGYSLMAGGSVGFVNLPATAPGYAFVTYMGASWISPETTYRTPCGVTPFSITRAGVTIETAPGAGKSRTYRMRVNEATPSGSTNIVLTDAQAAGYDPTGLVNVEDGDWFCWQDTPVNTPPYFFQDSVWYAAQYIPVPSSWVDIADVVEQEIAGESFPGGAARVLGELWTEDFGSPLPVVQARLYNVTDDVSVGESAEIQSDEPEACDFAVTLSSGTKRYRLQVTSDTPGVDIFFSGRGVGP